MIVDDRADAERAARTLAFPVALKPPLEVGGLAVPHQRQGIPGRRTARNCSRSTTGSRPWSDRFIAQEWVDGGVDSLYSCNAYFGAGARPLVTFVARKLRQWPPHTGTSALGEECRNDEVLEETLRLFAGVDYRGLAYVEMKRDARTGRHVIIEPNIGRPTGRSAIAEAGGVELLYTAYCDMVGLPLPAATAAAVRGREVDRRPPGRAVRAVLLPARRARASGDWWRSVRGPKWHAVLSRSDPEPFVHDVLQATRRGARMLGARARRSLRSRRRSPAPVALRGLPVAVLGIHDPTEAPGAGAGTAPLIEERR